MLSKQILTPHNRNMGPFIESPPLINPTAAVQASAPVGAPAKPNMGARVSPLAQPVARPNTWATKCFPDVKRVYPDLQKVVYPAEAPVADGNDDTAEGGRTGKRGKPRTGKQRENKKDGLVVEVREVNAEEVVEEGWETVKRKERKVKPAPAKKTGGRRNGAGGERKNGPGGKRAPNGGKAPTASAKSV